MGPQRIHSNSVSAWFKEKNAEGAAALLARSFKRSRSNLAVRHLLLANALCGKFLKCRADYEVGIHNDHARDAIKTIAKEKKQTALHCPRRKKADA